MSTQQHLLMIEDDQRLADMVVTYLGNNGLSVAHCPDATSGLQQLQRQPLPDLLILDLMLPDLDGLEVCRRLRALPGAAAEVPVLMLTAKGQTKDRERAALLGSNAFMTKPFSNAEVRDRLRAMVSHGEA